MDRSFRPSVDHLNHINLERELCRTCDGFSVKVVDVPSYYLLPNDEKELYAKSFSDESLYNRSGRSLLAAGRLYNVEYYKDRYVADEHDDKNVLIIEAIFQNERKSWQAFTTDSLEKTIQP